VSGRGTVAVDGRSALGPGLAAGLAQLLPEEQVDLVPAGEATPPSAGVFVTLPEGARDLGGVLGPGVAWVHLLGAGADGLDREAVGKRVVTCSRGAAAPAIAEWVMASVLSFEKQLPETWLRGPPATPWGQAGLGQLSRRTLGLIGLGAIGTEVARRALAFDMAVVACRRSDRPADLDGVRTAPLHEVLAAAHHLVLAAPATPATERLVDRDALARCRRGVHLVNVARGTLVDQDALLEALEAGTVARASLDVVDPEPLPAGHPLYDHPGVRLTPHISWSAPDTGRRTLERFTDNLARWRRGEPLTGLVDPSAGY
jgi:phosphoglycerate dehydrogenase-like enzyme